MANTVSNLESLIKTTIDSAVGYERAAETAKSPGLQQVLRAQAQKRRQTIALLNQELVRIGGTTQESGSALGAAHHVWTRISDAFGSGDEAAAERVEEGEDYIEEKFSDALEASDWDPQTRQVLQQAHAEIKEGERLADQLEKQYD